MAKRIPRGISSSLPKGTTLEEFTEYSEAVAYVEQLLGGDFPATSIAIVGTNLTSVERVRAKISYGKIAINGAVTGSWIGLLFFILFAGETDPTASTSAQPMASLGQAVLVGAGLGMLFQVIRFSISKTKRVFTSSSQMVAKKYEVMVPSSLLNEASLAYEKGKETKA